MGVGDHRHDLLDGPAHPRGQWSGAGHAKIPPEGATARRASRGKHAAATAIEALAAARRRRAVRRGRPGSRCGARGRRAKRPSVERPDDTLAVAAWARDVVMETERGPASSRPTASSTSSATTSRAGTRPPAGCGSSRSKGRRSDADTVTVTKNEILYSPVRQRRRRSRRTPACGSLRRPAGYCTSPLTSRMLDANFSWSRRHPISRSFVGNCAGLVVVEHDEEQSVRLREALGVLS